MKQKNITRITFASAFGTLFEWYDFLIFGIASVLVFNKLFFPSLDPTAAILASLLTFSVGFIARPIGGGIVPIFATWLTYIYGLHGVTMLMIVLAIITLISAMYANETATGQSN